LAVRPPNEIRLSFTSFPAHRFVPPQMSSTVFFIPNLLFALRGQALRVLDFWLLISDPLTRYSFAVHWLFTRHLPFLVLLAPLPSDASKSLLLSSLIPPCRVQPVVVPFQSVVHETSPDKIPRRHPQKPMQTSHLLSSFLHSLVFPR